MQGIPGLEDVLTAQIWTFLIVFVRLGAMMLTFPGIGEGFVSPRIRLTLALATAFLLTPVLQPQLPGLPGGIDRLVLLLVTETLVGLSIGIAARLLMSALNVAGNVIAMQSGLGFAMSVDPTQGSQGAILATFLVTLGIVMVFASGAHALLFGAIVHSYTLFQPGAALPAGEFLELIVRFVSGSFALGIALSAPFLVFSLAFYAGLGVVARLMPQFQVFFVSLPLSILAAFGLLLVLLTTMMQIFLDRFGTAFSPFAF
jgi:flagellar biosynthesis protein FliR